jgi:bifunctional DNA-binding transcriptional regulator/antitoxin component of YhaV-PrlF toxin-antitoxin module
LHVAGEIGGKKTSSIYLTLPKKFCQELKISKGDILVVERSGRRILIERYGKK